MGHLRAAAVTDVHVIVPEGIDDPTRPSGGNTYDRRVCDELAALGWSVQQAASPLDLARQLARIPDGVDRAARRADRLAGAARARAGGATGCGRSCSCTCRSRTSASARCSQAAAAVITTSEWARRRLEELYGLRGGARGRARRRRCRARARERRRRRAAVRRGGDARQGPRRAARRPRDGDGPVLALRVRGQPRPRPRVRRPRPAPRAGRRAARPRALHGPAHRRRARPRVRRRGPARARLARARPTGWSSPRPWPAACRCSPPTSAGCPRRSGHGRGCSSRPATRRPSAPRCAAGSRTPTLRERAAAGRAGAARVAARLGGHRVRRRHRAHGGGRAVPGGGRCPRRRRHERGLREWLEPARAGRRRGALGASSPSASRAISPRPARS